jgi:hypothetical protein
MKALEILKDIRNIETEYDHLKKHRFDQAIKELEDLENRSCDNCKKGFDCPILKKVWKDKLRKEGYLISRKEFYCRFWESFNEK